MRAARHGSGVSCTCGLFLNSLEPAMWPSVITAALIPQWDLCGIRGQETRHGEHCLSSNTAEGSLRTGL